MRISLFCTLAVMGVFISVAQSSQNCTINPSYLDFGLNVSKYAVGCLPEVNFELPASWAGQISVPGTENDELFFWLFQAEKQNQSDKLISERGLLKIRRS